MNTNQTPTRPRIVRIRHCEECGSRLHNDILDWREVRCAYCRSLPQIPEGRRACAACFGTGSYGFQWHGAPESEYCAVCNGVGHLDEARATRLRDVILASVRSEVTA